MDGAARNPNIFKVLDTLKARLESILSPDTSGFSEEELEEWRVAQNRFVFEGADIREKYVAELEDYLFSCEWTESERVREIVGYIQMGKPLCNIGALCGLQQTAFRLRMKRLSDKLYAILFDAQSCPEGIYSLTDLGALKKALLRLRLVRNPIDFNAEFSLRQVGWLKAHVEGSEKAVIGRENLDKYFQSVLFLALTSRTFTLNLLDDVDPSVLQYALTDMQANSVHQVVIQSFAPPSYIRLCGVQGRACHSQERIPGFHAGSLTWNRRLKITYYVHYHQQTVSEFVAL